MNNTELGNEIAQRLRSMDRICRYLEIVDGLQKNMGVSADIVKANEESVKHYIQQAIEEAAKNDIQ